MPDIKRNLAGFDKALNNLSRALDALASSAENHSEKQQIDIKVYQVLARQALEEVRPDIRAMLISNYEKSGIEDKTGKLRKAIGNVVIGAKFDAKRAWRIYVKFPSGEEAYSDKNGNLSNPYMVWAALGHGWVRTGKGAKEVSTKSKATAKRNALKHDRTTFKKAGSRYSVVPPRPFFYLDGGQQSIIQNKFVSALDKKIQEAMKGK